MKGLFDVTFVFLYFPLISQNLFTRGVTVLCLPVGARGVLALSVGVEDADVLKMFI